MIFRKIYRELINIRKELHSIRDAMESKPVDMDSIMGEIADELEKNIPPNTVYANVDTEDSEDLRKLHSKSLEKALASYNKTAERHYRHSKSMDVIQWAALILSISAILISLINLLH